MNDTSVKTELRCAFLLFLTAAIWGFAMAFQREGSRYLGPFAFNACRFLLGGCAMLPQSPSIVAHVCRAGKCRHSWFP